MFLISIISAIIIFSIIVLIHECGHYFSAKRHGVKVEEFGLGLPPKAKVLWKNKEGTEFTLNWIPFGGFVRMFGENSSKIREKGSFGAVSILGRMEIVLAGVFMNFILAWGILIFLFVIGTKPIILSKDDFTKYQNEGFIVMNEKFDGVKILNEPQNFLVLNNEKNENFFQKGDLILQINGEKVSDAKKFIELQKKFLSQKTDKISYQILRDGRGINLEIQTSEIQKNGGKLGIAISSKPGIKEIKDIKLGFFDAVIFSFSECFRISISTVKMFGEMMQNLFTKGTMPDGVSGPVGIAKATGGFVEAGDFNGVLKFMALISLSLAVVNVLPIPALDGGRFMFLLVEALIRRPLSASLEMYVNLFGYLFLMGLLIFVTIKDIFNLF
ncbi:M50 family metallopeptidase [Candidatus Gracilibacteria bacterium]|nr:M50 family metallopeptidase [Candidatus Gracilibacteria bacterium]